MGKLTRSLVNSVNLSCLFMQTDTNTSYNLTNIGYVGLFAVLDPANLVYLDQSLPSHIFAFSLKRRMYENALTRELIKPRFGSVRRCWLPTADFSNLLQFGSQYPLANRTARG